jgi:hypothetical protein
MIKTNSDIEQKLARELEGILRASGLLTGGRAVEIHLHRGTRKKRRDAAFEPNWNPELDSIRISFSPMDEAKESEIAVGGSDPSAATGPFSDLIRALDRAEKRPGYEFIALKWFRDTALPEESVPWAADAAMRHEMLREAIDLRWVLTSKIPNPRSPQFPVTAIRLNRQVPEVSAVLGKPAGLRAGVGAAGFRPVPIHGDLLSATVLRDRR